MIFPKNYELCYISMISTNQQYPITIIHLYEIIVVVMSA